MDIVGQIVIFPLFSLSGHDDIIVSPPWLWLFVAGHLPYVKRFCILRAYR